MPILPMLNAMSNDLVITTEDMTNIMNSMMASVFIVVAIGYSIKLVKRNLDLNEEEKKPFKIIRKFV